jgi:prefoldin subunit 5
MPEDAINTARELATHAADIAHLQRDMDKMAADMEEIKKSLANISNTLSEAKGGWRVLMLVAGASGTLASGLTWLVQHFWSK